MLRGLTLKGLTMLSIPSEVQQYPRSGAVS
jgi:hypothetical protein